MIHIIRGFIVWKLGCAEFKIKITLLCNYLCIVYGFGNIGKQLSHFLLTLEIELIGVKFKSGIITDNVVCCNADKHLLNFSIRLLNIMNIICGNKRNACFPCNTLNTLVNRKLFRQSVILQFKIIVPLTEYITVP